MLAEEFNLICCCNCALEKKRGEVVVVEVVCVCGGGYTGVGGVAVHATLKCNMHKK